MNIEVGKTQYFLTDSFGRSYFEGRSFSHDEAMTEAKSLQNEPHGVWIVPDQDGEAGEEIFPAH